MTNKIFRNVFLFITEGPTDLDMLRILLYCKLRSRNASQDTLKSPIDKKDIIKYLPDIVRIAPGSAFVGASLRYSIVSEATTTSPRHEVIILPMQAPYAIGEGYGGVVKTILYYVHSKVLEKKKIVDPIVESEYKIVGVIDIDVFEKKPGKPEHDKNIRENLHDLISRAKPSELDEDVKVDVILTGNDDRPRLVKLCVGNASAYLLFWGACRDREFYKAVEDVEATLLDVIAEKLQPQSKEEFELKEVAKRLSRILPRECNKGDYVHKYKACVLNDRGVAPMNLVSPLHLLAYSFGDYGEKHPNSLWGGHRDKHKGVLRKAVENDEICKELLERCELEEALDYILEGI